MSSPLPIDVVLPDIAEALIAGTGAVVLAAPGAGKTTRIPLHLCDAPWLGDKRIVMLEPRRLATRMAAARMASSLGENVGETVGFRVRLESRISARTRIEVVTEGILTRRLQRDPELAGVGLLIFDEFHERSLDADLGLALALDVQRALRPDLRILVMSATLDDQAVAKLLGDAKVIACAHRPFPVATRYLDTPRTGRLAGRELADDMASLIRRALAEEHGSLLAFLPGEAEIRRVQSLLEDEALPSVVVAPLYGALSPAEQARAVEPAVPRLRKVVLATTIAETSLTIEGVRIVVDCGSKRAPRFEPRRAMTELVTVRVSRASAEQRRGRAGRLEPGVCYRLWTEAEMRGLVDFDPPEIAQADLAPLALDLAAWGVRDPAALAWLTPPPAGAYAQAVALLRELEALSADGTITAEGRAMAALPLHPRLAHMVHRGAALGCGRLACDIAALLGERDVLAQRHDLDIRPRLDAVSGRSRTIAANRAAVARVRAAAAQIRSIAGVKDHDAASDKAGELLALAYPDRIAQRTAPGRYRLSGGGAALIDPADPLAAQEYLVVADLDGGAQGRIFLAAPITRADLEEALGTDMVDADSIAWDNREEAVQARRQRRLGALVIEDKPLPTPPPAALEEAVIAGIRAIGLHALPWTNATLGLKARVLLLRRALPEDGWPDFSDEALTGSLEAWLGPHLAGITRRSHFSRIDLSAALMATLPWPLPQRLEELAPTHIPVPSGSRIALDYDAEGGPALHVKLQEVFGLTETPAVAKGRIPVTLHLLSPAQRPVAVTRDLKSFWANVYPQVRGEMRGRYPRHIWPEDPLHATPTRRSIKPRGQ